MVQLRRCKREGSGEWKVMAACTSGTTQIDTGKFVQTISHPLLTNVCHVLNRKFYIHCKINVLALVVSQEEYIMKWLMLLKSDITHIMLVTMLLLSGQQLQIESTLVCS